MKQKEIIQKLKEKQEKDSRCWIKFDLNFNTWNSLFGWVHEIHPSFVTLHTDQGRISVGYSQITKIL